MPTLNIKDPEVYRLAAELAAQRGTSMTGAVRQALLEAAERHWADRVDRLARMREISRRSAALAAPTLSDDDLYDDRGLPR